MLNLIKSPHEILMEESGLPGYAEGHSVSPEQMKVELMINGRKVHHEDLPHDHPLIQHFLRGGSAVSNPSQSPGFMEGLSSIPKVAGIGINKAAEAVGNYIPAPVKNIAKSLAPYTGHFLNAAFPAMELYSDYKNGDTAGMKQNALDAALSFAPIGVQLGLTTSELGTRSNPDEREYDPASVMGEFNDPSRVTEDEIMARKHAYQKAYRAGLIK